LPGLWFAWGPTPVATEAGLSADPSCRYAPASILWVSFLPGFGLGHLPALSGLGVALTL